MRVKGKEGGCEKLERRDVGGRLGLDQGRSVEEAVQVSRMGRCGEDLGSGGRGGELLDWASTCWTSPEDSRGELILCTWLSRYWVFRKGCLVDFAHLLNSVCLRSWMAGRSKS